MKQTHKQASEQVNNSIRIYIYTYMYIHTSLSLSIYLSLSLYIYIYKYTHNYNCNLLTKHIRTYNSALTGGHVLHGHPEAAVTAL